MCKKEGFLSMRYDNMRNSGAVLLDKVCYNVEVEPYLTPIDNELLQLRTANTSNEAMASKRVLETQSNCFFMWCESNVCGLHKSLES